MNDNKIYENSPQVCKVIAEISTLRVFSLSNNNLNVEDLDASIDEIVKSQIHTLDISEIRYIYDGSKIMQKIAKSQIHTLSMKGNQLGPYYLNMVKSLIGSKVKNLDISGNIIGNDLLPIAKEIVKWPIHTVNLNQNYAESENYPLSAKELTKSPSLHKVKMFDRMQPEDQTKSEKIFDQANTLRKEAVFIGTNCFLENDYLPKDLVCKIIGDAQPLLIEYDMNHRQEYKYLKTSYIEKSSTSVTYN